MRRHDPTGPEAVFGRRGHHPLLAGAGQRDIQGEHRARVVQRIVDERVDGVPLVLVVEEAPFRLAADEIPVVLAFAVSEQGAEDECLEAEIANDLPRRVVYRSLVLIAADPGDGFIGEFEGVDGVRAQPSHGGPAALCPA